MYEIYLKLLEERGLRTADVCRETGISQTTMANWKKRRSKLGTKNALILAQFFGVSVEYLMGREEAPQTTPPEHQSKAADTKGYYIDDEALEMAQFLAKNPNYKVVFDAVRKVPPEDLAFIKEMIDRTT